MSKESAENLVKNVIIEVVKGSKSDNDDAAERVSSAISQLAKKFNMKNDVFFIFVRNQYRFLENLRLEFRFIKADKDSSMLLFRLEEELYKSLDFINLMTSYPFAIDLEKDSYSLKKILAMIEYLENVVECMFIYENEVLEEQKHKNSLKDEYLEDSKDYNVDINNSEASQSLISKQSSKIQIRSSIAIKKPGKRLVDENSQFMAEL